MANLPVEPSISQAFKKYTPEEIHVEPKIHPIEKENQLPNHHDFRFQLLIFRGFQIIGWII